jgi:Zn-finger nucleic acid-binding protein
VSARRRSKFTAHDMTAGTLNCPMCGASASTDASKCGHCGARLATVSCPSCFGMMFQGAKFCSHCGAPANRAEIPEGANRHCPRCRTAMKSVVIGDTDLQECSRCEGLWADTDTLQRICADREKQSAVLGMPGMLSDPTQVQLETVRYVPCPACNQLMHRVNFAKCSGVVVDVCKQHGTWFDRDELRRIVEFIRAGGIDRARAAEIADLERERARLRAERAAPQGSGINYPIGSAAVNNDSFDGFDLALSALGGALKLFLKK